MTYTTDVLVVGGGPSGLTVAAEAARSGAKVLVVEKRAISPVPRAGTLLPRPLELFDSRGIANRFIARISEFNPTPFQNTHIWAGMHPVDWTARDSRFPFTLFLSQHETEAILQEWVQETGVEIKHRTELIKLEIESERAIATVREEDGTELVIHARYIVGADGGRSTTRELAGIAWEGKEATFTGVVATVGIDFPWAGGLRVAHNELGWSTSFPFGPGQTRFTYVHTENRSRLQSEPITQQELQQSLEDIFGEHIEVSSIVSATRYGDAQKTAAALVQGPVVLVGESARVHYPASGVGMNFCIQDAFNVGWKLGAVIAGHADAALVESYETERRPVIDELIASVDAQVGVQFNHTKEGLAFLEFFSEKLMSEPDVTARLWDDLNGLHRAYALEGSNGAGVGEPVVDFELFFRDGSSARVYELLRDTDFLVVDLTGAVMIGSEEVLDLPARVVAGCPTRLPEALRGAAALLIRPDSYLAWRTDEAPAPGEVRSALLRALGRAS